MDLEQSKQDFMDSLNEVENEATILLDRIKKSKSELKKVKTKEDIDRFNSENEIEKGFEHIQLF